MTILFDPQDSRQFARAQDLLAAGVPLGLPSETVYGLGALALHPPALAQIFSLKARPHFDPLIVHVWDLAQAQNLILETHPLHLQLAQKFWPGPLTMLFKKSAQISDLCTAASPWVALRSPAHPIFRKFLAALKQPLAAPSANRFGGISPTHAQAVIAELGPQGLEAVVDGGPCALGLESTVVKVLNEKQIEIVRPGSLTKESLQDCLGAGVEIKLRATGSGIEISEAPGQLKSHYAPQTPLYFLESAQAQSLVKRLATERYFLLLVYPEPKLSAHNWLGTEVLSETGSDSQAATKLFAALRRADALGATGIVTLAISPHGLGAAINDRLRRASRTPEFS